MNESILIFLGLELLVKQSLILILLMRLYSKI